jgi:putative DNA primase/helicase
MLIFWGEGANGKSTFLGTILAMLGQHYAMQSVSELIMVRQGEAHPTERADLFGKRLVACIETDEGKKLAESLVKQLTGGDKIRARRMPEDYWEFEPTHKIIVAANHKPVIRGTDHGIWRRLNLVPFTVTISEATKDKHLPDKLKKELPGILNWALAGCLEWQRKGLCQPDAVTNANNEYRSEMDSVSAFLADCCQTGPDELRVRQTALYSAYVAWASKGGETQVGRKDFNRKIAERGIPAKRSDSNGVAMARVISS